MEKFSFKPFILLGLQVFWLVVLTALQVYKNVFKLTEEKNSNFISPPPSPPSCFWELQDGVEKTFGVSIVSFRDLTDEIKGPNIMEKYRTFQLERIKKIVFKILLLVYAQTVLKNLDSNLGKQRLPKLILTRFWTFTIKIYHIWITPGIDTINDFQRSFRRT